MKGMLSMKMYLWLLPSLLVVRVFALEQSMLDLKVPTRLEKGNIIFGVRHRFFGKVNDAPFKNYFGLTSGAGVGLDLQYCFGRGIEAYAQSRLDGKEYGLGARYSFRTLQILNLVADVHYFNYESIAGERRDGNVLYLVGIQGEPLLDRITPVVNVAYDGYQKHIGFGAGIDFRLLGETGSYIKNLNLLVEIYSAPPSDVTADKNSYSFGIKVRTYGHQFMIQAGNNAVIGPRRLMLGSSNSDLHLGFTILRMLGE